MLTPGKVKLTMLAIFATCNIAVAQYTAVNGIVSLGGKAVVVGTLPATYETYTQTYPGATVSVCVTGTSCVSLATIYTSSSGGAKANPFTADSTTAAFQFFIAPGTYDLRFSGTGIKTPWTVSSITVASGSGTGTVSSVGIAGASNQISGTGTCTITSTGTCTLGLTNPVVLGTDNSAAGTLQLANGSANAHTIWSSGATTTNTIAGFTAVPTTLHVVSCTVASTTCTLTDSGLLAGAGSISSLGAPNVLNYGADPTGTVDNSAAFVAACTATSAYGGNVIIPKGKYKFTSVAMCQPGTHFIGQGTVGGGPGTGAPNLSTVYLDCYTANLVPFQVGTLGTASYLGVEFDNVTFRDPNGNCGGALFVPNVSYAVMNNVGFQGFARGKTTAPTTPAGTGHNTGGFLAATTYSVMYTDNDATEHETAPGTINHVVVGGSGAGSITLATHTPTSPETCFNAYLGTSDTTMHLVAHCQAAGTLTITTAATGNVYPPAFDESCGYGAMFIGGSGGIGLATSYQNQAVIINPQVSLGTCNGIVADKNISFTYVWGGNLNQESNTVGCGMITGYAIIVTHGEEGGSSGSSRMCVTGYDGWLTTGLDSLDASGQIGINAVAARNWHFNASCSATTGGTIPINLDATSTGNTIEIHDNGGCPNPMVVDNTGGTTNTICDDEAGTCKQGKTQVLGGGSTTIYRCITAGSARAGTLTSVAADCGSSVAIGLSTQ